MRRALLLAFLFGAVVTAGRLQAQTRFYFGAPGDTALGLIPGTDMRIPIRSSYMCGTDSARLTVRYDPAVLQIDSATPAALNTGFGTATPGSGRYSVRGSGYVCGSDQELFTLHVTLQPASTGTYLWTSVDSLGLQYSAGDQALAQGRSSIGQVCHATSVFGDVDGNSRIDSRDALIVLSNAVGLPVTGFDLAAGDVDGDGLANSRDALLILTYDVGLSVPNAVHIGEGAPDACPGISAPGETVVFKRNGAGIELLGASSTTPTLVPNTVSRDSQPRLASNGTQIVYQCVDSVYSYYSEVCAINTDGTGRRPLTSAFSFYSNASLDVNPNGFRVLFQDYAGDYLNLAADTGVATSWFTSNGFGVFPYAAAWGRDSAQIAYTSGGFYTFYNSADQYQTRGLWKVDTLATKTFVQLDTAYASSTVPPRWSPAGDSVAYVRNDGRIWAVPASGGVPAVLLASFESPNNSSGITGFDWGPQGLIFSFDATGNGQHPSLWLLPSQNSPMRRITAASAGDWQPSFRRNP